MTEKQRKRIGYCAYCRIPIMDIDYYCVGCGAPAISLEESVLDNQHITEKASDKEFSLWADWNAPYRI